METKSRRVPFILVGLALLLAFLGQYIWARKREFLWDGLVLYALAMFLFARFIARIEASDRPPETPPSLWQQLWELLRRSPVRLAALAGGFVLSLYAAVAAGSRPAARPMYDLLALWAAGWLLATGAFGDWSGLPRRLAQLREDWRRHGPEIVLVALILLATFLTRAVRSASIPYVLSGDEASMGLEAVSVLKGQRVNPFVTGWLSHPTLYFFILAAPLRWFGIQVAALRLPSALVSTAIALLLYLWARRYYGRWVAILAAIFFAAYDYAIHYGRLALNNIWDPFFALGALYFLSVGLEKKRPGAVAVGGLLTGLAIYFYMGARLVPIIIGVYLLHWAWRQRDFWRENLPYLVVLALLALIAALPLLMFFRAHPADFMARWNWVGIFPSGWVNAEMQRTGKSMASILWGQFLKAVLAFHYFPDPTFWYHPGTPLLQFVPSVLFVFGLTYACTQWRKREYFLLVSWFFLVIIFGGMLLENPPSSARLVLAIPPVVLCVALGSAKVATAIQHALAQRRGLAVTLSLALMLGVSYQSAHFYFGVYTPKQLFSDPNTLVADTMGKYLRLLGPEYQCYFFGAPRIFYGHATIPFLAQGVTGTDITKPIVDKVDFVNPARNAVFIFLPERRGELDVVRRFYPTGRLREFRNMRGELLYVAYEVDLR